MRILRHPEGSKARRERMSARVSLHYPSPSTRSRTAVNDGCAAPPVPAWKRALDISCIVLLLPGWLFALVLIGAAIRAVSPGPVFSRQERVGFRRTRFVCLKFRSMKTGGDPGAHRRQYRGTPTVQRAHDQAGRIGR